MTTPYGDRPSKKLSLPWDNKRDAYTCRRRGWKIDNDGWWYRRRTKSDTRDFKPGAMGFTSKDRIVARDATCALGYDRQ